MFFVLIAKDKPGMGEVRLATRDAHRAHIWRTDLTVKLRLGAPMMSEDGAEMIGSWLLIEAENRSDVEAFAADDPYAQKGLFAEVEIRQLHDGFDFAGQLAKGSPELVK